MTTTRSLIIALIVLLLLLFAFPSASATVIDGYDFAHEKVVRLEGSGSLITEYQFLFNLYNVAGDDTPYSGRDYTSMTNGGYDVHVDGFVVQADWDDIRFTDKNHTPIPYWVESISDDGQTAKVWVKAVHPQYGFWNEVHVFYGSETAVDGEDPYHVFPLFDDFTGDLSKWNTQGIVELSGGVVNIRSYDVNLSYLLMKSRYDTNYAFHFKMKTGHVGKTGDNVMFTSNNVLEQMTMDNWSDQGLWVGWSYYWRQWVQNRAGYWYVDSFHDWGGSTFETDGGSASLLGGGPEGAPIYWSADQWHIVDLNRVGSTNVIFDGTTFFDDDFSQVIVPSSLEFDVSGTDVNGVNDPEGGLISIDWFAVRRLTSSTNTGYVTLHVDPTPTPTPTPPPVGTMTPTPTPRPTATPMPPPTPTPYVPVVTPTPTPVTGDTDITIPWINTVKPTLDLYDVYYRPKQDPQATIPPTTEQPFNEILIAAFPDDWSQISMSGLVAGVFSPYTIPLGGLFWLALLGVIAAMIYLYTDSTLIPGILLMCGGVLFMGAVPPSFQLVCYLFMALGLVGSLYALVNKR